MRRKKKSKRGIIDEDIPEVSENEARRQVIYGGIGFVVSLVLVLVFRPGTEHLLVIVHRMKLIFIVFLLKHQP